jgi:hypothetical protein
MKFRGLLVAVVLLAALGGVLYWSQRHKPGAEPANVALPAILKLDAKSVTALTLRPKGAPPIVLQPAGQAVWKITAPIAFRANSEDVGQMVSTLANVVPERVVDDSASNLAPYGLSDPALIVDVTLKNNQTAHLLLGDKTPTGESIYAMVPGNPHVYTLNQWVDNTLGKSLDDLRDRHLVPVQTPDVNQVEIVRSGEDYLLARDPDGWHIQKPVVYRANNYEINTLVGQIVSATWDASTNTASASSAFAHGTPLVTVKVTTGAGAGAQTDSLEVRKSHDDDYAQSSAIPGVWKVDAALATTLDRGVDAYRNKDLVDFGFTEPLNIQYHDGATTLSLVRSNRDWYSNGKKMDSASVEALVSALRSLAASKFVDTGYSKPDIDLTLVTLDGRSTEKIHFQKTPDGAIAKREDGPGLYFFDSGAMQNLYSAVAGVKPAPPPSAPNKK